MRCIVIDDEPMAIEIIEGYVQKTPFLEHVASFDDGISALTWLADHSVDLLFLDINMPDLSGIQLVEALDAPPAIIFTTAYAQHAVIGFDLNAVDYLLKPVGFPRFLKAAQKARQRLVEESTSAATPPDKEPGFLFVKSGHRHVRLEIERIRYVSSEKNYVNLVTDQKRVMALLNMEKVLAMLPDDFMRVHKRYIVAVKHVDVVEKGAIYIGNIEIPIGEAYRKAFFDRIGR